MIFCYSNPDELRHCHDLSRAARGIHNLQSGTESEEDGVRTVDPLKQTLLTLELNSSIKRRWKCFSESQSRTAVFTQWSQSGVLGEMENAGPVASPANMMKMTFIMRGRVQKENFLPNST